MKRRAQDVPTKAEAIFIGFCIGYVLGGILDRLF
jgi:hypothetical protein